MFRLKMNLSSCTLSWLLTIFFVIAEPTFQMTNKNVENKRTIRIQCTASADITCKIEEYGDIENLDKDADNDDTCPIDPDGVSTDFTRYSGRSFQQPLSDHEIESSLLDNIDRLELKENTVSRSWSTNEDIKPAFTSSLFPNIPPTINFVAEGEEVEELPMDLRKLLKWKSDPRTTRIVKRCVTRVGFKMTKNENEWLGTWGSHMKPEECNTIRSYQKYNHFPGTWSIGRKDSLWRNLNGMKMKFGEKEFGFLPQTFVIPKDLNRLELAFEEGGPDQMWIVKPPASTLGKGIEVVNKLSQISMEKKVIVQRYITRPYLINDHKFDLRIYVYISSFDPLRLYVFENGFARFASMKYSSSKRNIHKRFIHLTNYSVNKHNAAYQHNDNETACEGHKWSLETLWNYMEKQGVNTTDVWEKIKDAVVKTIISADTHVNNLTQTNCKSRYCVHEVFGFDILLDENLKPWLLEVNIGPSLYSSSQIDININDHMIKDLFNIAGFHIPDKNDLHKNAEETKRNQKLSNYRPPNKVYMDKRLFNKFLSYDQMAKHAFFCQIHQNEKLVQSILDILTPDDIRILTETIDEDNRKGGFQRLFPSPSSHKYLKYFETTRYYNLLLDQWIQQHNQSEATGILLLQALCDEKIHLDFNSDNNKHQWMPPRSIPNTKKADDVVLDNKNGG